MKNHLKYILPLGLLLFSLPAWAASTKEEIASLKEEVASLKEGQEEMQKTLGEIKKMLESGARGAAAPAGFKEQVFSVENSPFKGDESATLTLVEFSDYQCPFCARHYRDVLPKIVGEYVSSGKVKYVMMENPLTAIHKQAFDASMAALCAQDEAKYWDMHNVMFENQKRLSNDDLKTHAATIGLDSGSFADCLDSRKYQKQVERDMATATRLGVRGTPSFLLGVTDEKDPTKALMKVYIRGAQSFDNFKANIDEMLDSLN